MSEVRSKSFLPEYTKACDKYGVWWVNRNWLDEERNPTPEAPEAFRKEMEAHKKKMAEHPYRRSEGLW